MKIEVKIFIVLTAVTLATLGVSQSITFATARDSILSIALLVALIGAATYFCSQTITKPLQTVTEWANSIAQSRLENSAQLELDNNLEISTHDGLGETKELAAALQQIESLFNNSARHFAEIAVAKDRMENELEIGRQIQMNMLMLTFPSFPKHDNLDLYATLKPAREVSGDFYDFYFYREGKSYLLGANRLCFCVGDVSGKGVPAAFFMAVTKILLRSQADQNSSPAIILSQVNQIISADNPACMFTTLFFGTLNLLTGELVYSNAGHNPPYVQRHEALEHLNQRHGPALGIVEDFVYPESRTTLSTGDILIVFTDGVTEAMDRDRNLFSERRLVEVLQSGQYHSAKEVISLTTDAVSHFQGDAEQADDLTMLSLKFLGQSIKGQEDRSKFLIREEILAYLREE